MSGIFGIFRFDDAPVLPEDLEAMAQAMAYYGPDGGGTWRGPGVGLGARLRRVTPEDAFESQPLCVEGQVLVATGRLDNREELCTAFGISAADSATLPDSALILRAHQRWGEACVDHLLGDWSFAVWDPFQQRLLVARDQHGNTGLYFHQNPHRLVFASHLKALRALPDTPQRPDFLKVAQILVSWPGDGIRTAYEELHSLPPAHILRAGKEGASTHRYWFPETQPTLELSRDEDYLEQFLEIYSQAVHARLRSAKPVGASLSAGLDSGSVAALAAPLLAGQGRSLTAFTAVPRFADPSNWPAEYLGNEWDLAQAAAHQAGVGKHWPVRAESITLLDSLRRQVELHDGPGHSGANYHWMLALLEQARSEGMGVLLTGQQGNASISYAGGGSLWWPNLFRGEIKQAWRGLRESEPNPWLAFKRQVLKPLLLPGIQAYRRAFLDSGSRWLSESAIHPALVRQLDLGARMAREGFDPTFVSLPEALNLYLLRLGRQSVGALWHELGAGFGLDIRDPTADRRVIEFCLRCPDSQYRRKGEDRLLIRRAMVGRLTAEVLLEPRKGLQAADLGFRVLAERAALAESLGELARHPLPAHCLDLPRLTEILSGLKPATARAAYADCGCVLLRGINCGLFLQRF